MSVEGVNSFDIEKGEQANHDTSASLEKHEIEYKSEDIGKKEAKEYFVNIDQNEVKRIEQRHARKAFMRENNQKIKNYSLLYAVIVVISIVSVFVAAIIIRNYHPGADSEMDTEIIKDAEEADKAERAYETFSEIRMQFEIESQNESTVETAYINAKDAVVELLANTPDEDKINIVVEYSRFVTDTVGRPEDANDFLKEYEQYATTNNQKIAIYSSYSFNYLRLGEYDKATEYDQKIEAILPEDYLHEDL